jgi:hypothetical protein
MKPFGTFNRDEFNVRLALGPYQFFVADVRKRLEPDYPGDYMGLARRMSAMWEAMSERERAPYQAMSDADKQRFETEVNEAIAALPEHRRRRVLASKARQKEMVRERERDYMHPFGSFDRNEFNVPLVLEPYQYFAAEIRRVLERDYPGDYTGLARRMRAMWEAMSDSEREPYQAKSDAAKHQRWVDANIAIDKLSERRRERVLASRELSKSKK